MYPYIMTGFIHLHWDLFRMTKFSILSCSLASVQRREKEIIFDAMSFTMFTEPGFFFKPHAFIHKFQRTYKIEILLKNGLVIDVKEICYFDTYVCKLLCCQNTNVNL